MKNAIEALLEDDHASLDELLSELDLELETPNFARWVELLDLFWARLAVHIRAEHLQLFPALTNVVPQLSKRNSVPTLEEVETTLGRLRSDHDFFMKELARLMKEARETETAEAGDFRERLAAIRKRLEIHNQIEERHVYLWPALLLDESTVAALYERIQLELKNMPPRFAAETQ